MNVNYDPENWFWVVGGDETKAWSSHVGAYVETFDTARLTRIETEDDLGDVLRPYGLVVPKPTADDYAAAIQARVDAVARTKQYNDGATLAGYATDPNSTYASDASSFVTWRSAVWVYANAQLALVLSGQRAQPTADQIVSELPAPPWPVS